MKGFLFVDKEKGMSSFDVVRIVRGATGVKKVGHSGTLDPLATGLLVVAVGEGTKLLEYFVGHDKEYEFGVKFGYVSDTYDAEGKIEEVDSAAIVSREEVSAMITEHFLGEIEQIPPKYSAIKVDGKRAYDVMRRGGDVEMKPRKIHIYDFEIVEFTWPDVIFRVRCGSGTYVRSLAHDLGQVLTCGGYVSSLNRSKVGRFDLKDAVGVGELDKKNEQSMVRLESVVGDFPLLELSDDDFGGLSDGKVLLGKKVEQGGPTMAFYKGKLVGMLENFAGGIKFGKRIL
jgi:tRNA pseudouridine55 synthase